ncbi:MAG: ADP-ribosylglycohydrolase family protein, partial [Actinomycetes bacterium]
MDTGLTPVQRDRAEGVLLTQACGDALGVPYEFAAPPPPGEAPVMRGGGLGPYAPGEYSDDTQMAVCIAEVAATGADLTSEDALDEVAERFLTWRAEGASDIGILTRSVLGAAVRHEGRPADRLRRAARAEHDRTGRTAGNGALMRTGVVGLAYLGDPAAAEPAARAVAGLTHADPLAGDACVLWSVGVATAVVEGTFAGVRAALDLLPTERRDQWARWLDDAEGANPGHFAPNGFTVTALQAAYAAITATPGPPNGADTGSAASTHLQRALEAAVRAGDDTDTVAAIAGA